MFRVTAQMMIKMMDKNEDGKIDDSELNYDFDFEESGFDTANVSKIHFFASVRSMVSARLNIGLQKPATNDSFDFLSDY